jgi:Protein of unknown function (DUF2490)
MPVFSQDKFVPQHHLWFRYYNQTQLSEKFNLHVEAEERVLFNPTRQFQFFVHAHVHYRLNPWLDLAAGGNFNFTNSTVNTALAVPELRPWQEATLTKKLTERWQFQLRYRLDERFIHQNDKIVLTDGYRFNLRHRFRVQISRPMAEFNNHTLTLKLSDEVMINTGDVPRPFDQNRFYASLEISLNDRWSIESGYLNLIQPKTDREYYVRNIVRSTLYHRINAIRKKE